MLVTIHGVQEKNFHRLVGRLSGYGNFFLGHLVFSVHIVHLMPLNWQITVLEGI